MVLQPIGGQSAIRKWKWGQDADEMHKKPTQIHQICTVKIKQSTWGINPTLPSNKNGC
jgi:hypothetical protein